MSTVLGECLLLAGIALIAAAPPFLQTRYGDISFQQKCIQRIERFKSQGCTILLVSHEPALIRKYCDEAIWLNAGKIVSYGKAAVVTRQYVRGSKS